MFGSHNFFLAGSSIINGEAVYTAAGTYTWVVPAGVTKVSVVCVGGGGGNLIWDCGGFGGNLRYKNDIAVTAGQSLTVVVGAGGAGNGGTGGNSYFINTSTVCARGGRAANGSQTGTDVGDGGGNGGTSTSGGGHYGGGGAGGYSGNGGNGDQPYYVGQAQSGSGGGGGGGGGQYNQASGGGGGVGLYGQGANGAGNSNGGNGLAGSGGDSTDPQTTPYTRLYGGAAGSGWYGESHAGTNGGVRIIWSSGLPRTFPSTNAGYLA